MIRLCFSRSQTFTVLLTVVWFIIWGICPWNSTSAAAKTLIAAHATHGHQETDDTHHASKGVEHSCSGSINLVKQAPGSEKNPLKSEPGNDSTNTVVLPTRVDQPYDFIFSFSHKPLPKRVHHLYQFNQSLRL